MQRQDWVGWVGTFPKNVALTACAAVLAAEHVDRRDQGRIGHVFVVQGAQ